MDKLVFTPAIDLPLSCLALLALLIHFHVWAGSRQSDTSVDLRARLSKARIRVITLFIGMVGVCWLCNFPVWAIFATLIAISICVSLILGNIGDSPAFLVLFVAFIVREWSFGFPLMILHPRQLDTQDANLQELNRELLGAIGEVVTTLRPCGQADIMGRLTSVVSETGELVDVGTKVIVSDVKSGRICVRPMHNLDEDKVSHGNHG